MPSPFGGALEGTQTRYQQAYDSSLFSGPITIIGMRFDLIGGTDFRSGYYTLSLSAVSVPITSLSSVDLGGNISAGEVSFGTHSLRGAEPAVLQFLGGPFNYDPSAGNLLLDVIITINGATSNDRALCGERIGDQPGFYRVMNSGAQNISSGLVTTLVVVEIPEPSSIALVGAGLALAALGRRKFTS